MTTVDDPVEVGPVRVVARLAMDGGWIVASLVSVVLLATGCVAGSPASPTPTTTPVATLTPAATPIPTETPTALEPITVDSIAVVVTNELLVRSKPGIDAGSKKLSPLLNAGQDVYVLAGPVAASGYQWYEVDPTMGAGTHFTPRSDPPSGWVAAASKEGVPWLLPRRGVCTDRDLPEEFSDLADLHPTVGLACFGDRPMSFEATLGTYETCGQRTWTIEPQWLGDACLGNDDMWLGDPDAESYADVGDQVDAAFAPGVDTSRLHPGGEPRDWIRVRLTGQFDHPVARTCHGVSDGETVPLDPDAIILACRAQFAITSIEVAE
jgi:hypothetical protein